MSDHWIIDAERRSNELADYNDWINANESMILSKYIDSLDENHNHNVSIDDVDDDFIYKVYEDEMLTDN